MITLNREIYRCSHCGKYYLKSHACKKHEIYCKKNLANRHMCFEFCKHLVREVDFMDPGDNGSGGYLFKSFHCALTGIEMYSFKAEYQNTKTNKVDLTGLTRMPLDCNEHDYTDKIKEQY